LKVLHFGRASGGAFGAGGGVEGVIGRRLAAEEKGGQKGDEKRMERDGRRFDFLDFDGQAGKIAGLKML